MAFLFRTPGSKNWIAGFKDGDGKRRNRSTGTTVQKAAQKIADEYEAIAKGKRTSRQVRKTMAELHKEITGAEMAGQKIGGYIDLWLAGKKPTVEVSTYDFYAAAAKKFTKWLGGRTTMDIGEITAEMITEFRNDEAASGLAGRSVNHELKVIRMIFKEAHRDNTIAEDPTQFVKQVRQKSRGDGKRRAFTAEELKAVLAVADDEWRSMTIFGLYTGQRLGDMARLLWEHLDKSQVSFITGKGDRQLIIPMAPPLLRHVQTLKRGKPQDPVHPAAFASYTEKGRTNNLSGQFVSLLVKAGLRRKIKHTKGEKRQVQSLSFHSLRATATTMLHTAGVPAAVAQELIGHDSEEIHRAYVRVGHQALREAADKLPDITQ